MALKHIVLGLLADQPDHGYRLKQRISPGLPREELINDGVLYPLLRRLEDDGLVTSTEEAARGRTRRVFRTTAAGRREFRRWLASEEDEGGAPRHLLYAEHPLVKLLFAKELTQDEVGHKIDAQIRRSQERIDAYERLAALSPPAEGSPAATLLELELAEHRERVRFLRRAAQRPPA